MLAIVGEPGRDMDVAEPGQSWDVAWVPITAPDPDPFVNRAVYAEGAAGGGAAFSRLEGCWYGDGRITFVATSGGPAGAGQVFVYEPDAERLRLLVSSPHGGVLQGPDNVTVSPRGGVLLCEDGAGSQFLQGLTPQGEVFRFAQNRILLDGERGFRGDFSNYEFCGATWSPNGRWLFVNVQTPGISFAIRGEWEEGPL
jgi:secreted PhoX family phosphatase